MSTPHRLRSVIVAAVVAILAASAVFTASPAQAAARPLFEMPFPCGEQWRLATYDGHDDYEIDMTRPDWNSNGRPIVASFDGKVIASGYSGGAGNRVRLYHGNGWQSEYYHMIDTPIVSHGQHVTQGQVLGYVGSTGNSSGPHLHYAQRANGTETSMGTVVQSYFNGTPADITDDARANSYIDTSHNCGNRTDSITMLYGHSSDLSSIQRFTSNGAEFAKSKPWESSGYAVERVGNRIVQGDFDGNGTMDIATAYDYGSGAARIHVWLDGSNYQGGNGWWSTTSGFTLNNVDGRMVAGDFNNDGNDDIAMLYGNASGTAAVHLFSSTGSSFNHTKPWQASGYTVSQVGDRLVAGDFDGNGKDDLAAAYDYGSSAARIHVWLDGSNYQGGNGWWTTPSGYTLNAVEGRMAAGDFNNDGKDDVAMLYGNASGSASIHRFTSGGTGFAKSKVWESSGYTVSQVGDRLVAGDFDGNGKDDLAAAYDYGSSAARIHVWLDGSNYQGGNGWWSTTSGFTLNNVDGRMA